MVILSILILNFSCFQRSHIFVKFHPIFKLPLHCRQRFRRLPLTGRRLGAAAASTTLRAGDKRSIPHKNFRGVTAAVAPNRLLAAGILSFLLILFPFFYHKNRSSHYIACGRFVATNDLCYSIFPQRSIGINCSCNKHIVTGYVNGISPCRIFTV